MPRGVPLAGKRRPKAPFRPDITPELIAQMYTAGKSGEQIAQALGATRALIYKRMKDAEFSRRTPTDWARSGPSNVRWRGGKTASAKRSHERNPERRERHSKANMRVAYAIRKGRLVRPTVCEQCGSTDRKIEAAHHDYSRPLDVRWLCQSCHVKWDHAEPKTLASIDMSVYDPLPPVHGEQHPWAKLTEADVRSIRARYAPRGRGGMTQAALAEEYGVCQPVIGDIVRRVTWAHVTD